MWRANNGASGTIHIKAWWAANFVDGLLYAGNTPSVWTTLNCGVPNALVVLKMVTTDVGGYNIRFRRYGEAKEVNNYGESLDRVDMHEIRITYTMMLTDALGRIEWKGEVNKNVTCTLVCFINPASFSQHTLHDGVMAAWADIGTPFGKGLLFCRCYNKEVAADPFCLCFREDGETDDMEYEGGCTTMAAYNDEIAHVLVLVDEAGLFEGKKASGTGSDALITSLAYSG
ncbi:hypothetical protein ES703_95433 [subsurface metagenome]